MMNEKSQRALAGGSGIFSEHGSTYLFSHPHFSPTHLDFTIESSEDGFHFVPYSTHTEATAVARIANLRFSKIGHKHVALFTVQDDKAKQLQIATSDDLIHWKLLGTVPGIQETACLAPNFLYKGKLVLVYGDAELHLATGKDVLHWEVSDKPLIATESNFYGQAQLKPALLLPADGSLLLFYYAKVQTETFTNYQLKLASLDADNPESNFSPSTTLWQTEEDWATQSPEPIGIAYFHDSVISYWLLNGSELVSVFHPLRTKNLPTKKSLPKVVLSRLQHNPILQPLVHHFWESKATFNPAALFEGGKVHLVYRAIGEQDVSVLGYAASTDGLHFDERHVEPIYIPRQSFESSSPYRHTHPAPSPDSPYVSGGGCFGGCEDPRLSRVDDIIYMTYVAYDGYGPPRVALTSITAADFLANNWNWSEPVLISRPGEVNKNACILSEKINGKFVVFHRVYPDILIDYVDDLNFGDDKWLEGQFKISPRKHFWDSRKVGIGAPPLKTDAGWLLIYQAVGDQDAGRYKVGAMLLDLEHPEKVLYRCRLPILEPEEWYENEGHKSGVVYPCGAVIKDDTLFVYYGGADTVVCCATAELKTFIAQLQQTGTPVLKPVDRSQGTA